MRPAFITFLVAGLALPALAETSAPSASLWPIGQVAQNSAPAEQAPPPVSTASVPKGTFAISDRRFHDDPVIGWEGFISGLRGFEHFYNPVGNPLYFETPFNNTSVRLLFIHHEFPEGSQLQGGDLNVYALQARIALTERLGFIATKDGYSELDADALPEDEGWNDIALGLKYALIVDRETDFVGTLGFRWMLDSGDDEILQSGNNEISPFFVIAKGWDKFHTMANITARIPFDDDDGNNILQWDLHFDYEIFAGFAPIIEIHGLHYLSDGDRYALEVGGLDYTNLGSNDVEGSSVVWAGFGARWKFTPNFSVGGTYEIALTDPDDDIMDDRITLDFEITW